MNKVLLTGRLTKDCEVVYKNDEAIAKGTIAVRKNVDQSIFIDFVAFKNQAVNLSRFAKKGHLILLDGSWDVSIYEKNGQKHRKDNLIINTFELLEKKEKSTDDEQKDVDKKPANDDVPADDNLPF